MIFVVLYVKVGGEFGKYTSLVLGIFQLWDWIWSTPGHGNFRRDVSTFIEGL